MAHPAKTEKEALKDRREFSNSLKADIVLALHEVFFDSMAEARANKLDDADLERIAWEAARQALREL